MINEAGQNRFFPSVSPAHFSFFEAGEQAKIQPSYLLFPQVRLTDQRISLTILRTSDQQRSARTANFRAGQRSPAGQKQVSYAHYFQRFKQPASLLNEVRQYEQEQEVKSQIKGLIRKISRLAGQPRLTLEQQEELESLRGQLSPSYSARKKQQEEAARAQFNDIWRTIKTDIYTQQ